MMHKLLGTDFYTERYQNDEQIRKWKAIIIIIKNLLIKELINLLLSYDRASIAEQFLSDGHAHCSRSIQSIRLGWGLNRYSTHYKASALANWLLCSKETFNNTRISSLSQIQISWRYLQISPWHLYMGKRNQLKNDNNSQNQHFDYLHFKKPTAVMLQQFQLACIVFINMTSRQKANTRTHRHTDVRIYHTFQGFLHHIPIKCTVYINK